MDFNEKLQELRKRRGLTQEELAETLFVSRTAISKWESGRGYPTIDSLKQISKYFSVSLDELLSGDELLTAAQQDNTKRIRHLQDIVFGVLDCAVAMFLFLPFFGERVNGVIREVPLLSLTQSPAYIKIPYVVMVSALILLGLLTLALQNCEAPLWVRSKQKLSLGLSALCAMFFIASTQPYAALFTFLFLLIKALLLIKWV